MNVNIRNGGEGVACWNGAAINEYATDISAKETRIATRNPDIEVLAGSIACQGCVLNQHGLGAMCTAQLTKTQYAIIGERLPRPEVSVVTRQVPGFELVKPGSRTPNQDSGMQQEQPEKNTSAVAPPAKKHLLKSLIRR